MTQRFISLLVSGLLMSGAALAQVPQYGTNVNYEQARKAVAGAIAEARKIAVPMAVAVLDTAGQLVAFERMDNTQTASTMIAQDKGASAAMYRRSTKVFQDLVAGGGVGLRVLQLRGAIGVSGGSSEQDGVVAKAGQESMLK